MLTKEYYSIAITISCVTFILISVFRLLNWVWFKPIRLERKLRQHGFHGNPYRLVFGDMKEETRMAIEARSKPISSFSNDYRHRIDPFYQHTFKKHGQKCFIWKGPTPIVSIAEPELIRKVYTKMHQFQKLQSSPAVDRIFRGLGRLEGEEWNKHRKILNPAFRTDKLKLMIPAFITSSVDMLNKWEIMCAKEGSSEVNVWPYLRDLSADAISRAAFGSSYQEGCRIFELITEQINLIRPIINSVHIPGWRFVPTKRNLRIMTTQREIRSLLRDMIIKRQRLVKAGEKQEDNLLGTLLLLLGSNNNIEKRKVTLSIEEAIDECKTFYSAGQGTTSTLLVWTLILMSKYPKWQELAREEVFTTFGNDTPKFLGLNNLKLLNMILQEVLRLYSPIAVVIRKVCEEVKLGDIVLPEGVTVTLPTYHVHQDPSLWGPDASEFNPNRFKNGLSKASGGNVALFAFGWGPRNCIGSNFAMAQAKVTLVLILQRFSFKLSSSYVHAPIAKETLQPEFGAQIILQPLTN